MKTRLLTAAIGVPLLIVVLIVRGWIAELVIVLFTVLGLMECYHALSTAGYHASCWGGFLAAALMWPMDRLMGTLDPLMLLLISSCVSLAGVMFKPEPSFPDAAASIYPLVTCLLPMSMLMMMLDKQYGSIPGFALVAMTFSIAYLADGLAYFCGRRWGKHKLCPSVSPKKTVEGAVFGLLGGLLGAYACRFVFVSFSIPMPGWIASTVLGLVGSAAGQLGDLSASLLKRYSGIKDYGGLFPGHGGVMDRLDSVFFAIIVTYCYTALL